MGIKNVVIILMITCLGLSCSSQPKLNKIASEGKIQSYFIQYYVNTKEDVKDYNYSIWYKDSVVIIQYVATAFDLDHSMQNKPAAFLKTLKYVYLDLKSMRCQDYLSFDSAATALDNYQLKKDEYILWSFFSKDSANPFSQNPIYVSDTIIEKKTYKKLVFKMPVLEQNVSSTIYMTDQFSQNLFHFSYILDKKYYPFRSIRQVDNVDGRDVSESYFKVVSDSLTEIEKGIFKKWEYNAIHTNLPLLTLAEALQVKTN